MLELTCARQRVAFPDKVLQSAPIVGVIASVFPSPFAALEPVQDLCGVKLLQDSGTTHLVSRRFGHGP